MKYLLQDVEYWFYDGNNYPVLLEDKHFVELINKQYDVKQLDKIENTLKDYWIKQKYTVSSIMNPLYTKEKMTVISLDLVKTVYYKKSKNLQNPSEKILKNINELLIDYQKRLDYIFSTGNGHLERFRKNNILFSKDKHLFKIENKISEIVSANENTILLLAKKYNSEDILQSLRWTPKNKDVINLFFAKLTYGTKEEQNEILLQLIPLIKYLNNKEQHKISSIIINKILLIPSSVLRNKAISILSEIPDCLKSASPEFLKFIKILSKSKQLNTSYPAKEILRDFNDLR